MTEPTTDTRPLLGRDIAVETRDANPGLAWVLSRDSEPRQATPEELSEYAARRDSKDWVLIYGDPDEILAPARPLPAPSLPQCSCARCTDGPDEPAEGQGAPARSEKEPEPPAPVLEDGKEDALRRFGEQHDAQDAREGTAVIPVADHLTEALPAVGAEGRSCDE